MARHPELSHQGEVPLRPRGADREIETAAAAWFARRDAGLGAEEEGAWQEWLAADSRHAAAYAHLETAWSTFGRGAESNSAQRLLGELAVRRSRRRRRRGIAAAAMLTVAVIGGFGITRWREQKLPAAPDSVAVLHRPAQRTLPDGSIAILRDGAEITVVYSATRRSVTLLKGEAIFEVNKDPARPFVVGANGIDVRAVGTAFSVHCAGDAVDVLVTEGTVSVATAAADTPAVSGQAPPRARAEETAAPAGIMVPAGNRVVVSASRAVQPVELEAMPAAEIERRLSWRAPRVEFSGMPLSEAVALLNQEAAGRTAARLRIADRDLDSMRVSGIFRTDNMDAFVLLLEAGFGVRVERAGEMFVLSKEPGR